MSLKDRLKISSENYQSEEEIISSPIIKESYANEIFNEILTQDNNILVYCDINIPTYRAINYICSKIDNDKRLVGIGSNLLLNPDEIIKFEPETKNQSKELIKTAINLNPYKIVLQDFDGVEAVDIFKLVNAGIKNIICAVNASSPQKALCQMELNLYMNGVQIPQTLMRTLIAEFVDKIIYIEKFNDGYTIKNIYNVEIDKNELYQVTEIIKEDNKLKKTESEKSLQKTIKKESVKEDDNKLKKTKVERPLQAALIKKNIKEKLSLEKENKIKIDVIKESKKKNILAAKLKKKKINKN